MRLTIAALLLIQALPASAQDISGPGRAADGDSLDLSGISVRLFGIDAPELAQSCQRGAAAWPCGKDAASKLAGLVAGKSVACEQKDMDVHGRIVAICRAGGVDLAGAMIDAGLAVAMPGFSDRYVGQEQRARSAQIGLWGSRFQMPADYRAEHPRAAQGGVKVHRGAAAGSPPRPAPSSQSAYFANCREAWAAGAAPLRRGQPGYRPEMDGDGDGIACEPYRRR